MATSSTGFTARLEAAEIYYGPTQCRSWTFAADVASDTNDEYVELNYINEDDTEVEGYIWFNVAGAGVDPTPAGRTLIAEVAYAAAATGEDRLDATIVALDALGTKPLFTYKKSSTTPELLVIDNAYPGAITAEAVVATEKITRAVLRVGSGGLLGPTKDAISATIATTLFDVKSNQTGELVLDQIIQGTTASMSTSILDFSAANKQVLIANGVGDSVVDGADTIIGLGQSKLFQNVSDIGARLILHPIRLARTDRSADLVFWSTLAQLNEIPYDGTDTQAVSVEFTAGLDQSKNTAVNLATFGSEWISNAIIL